MCKDGMVVLLYAIKLRRRKFWIKDCGVQARLE